MMKKSWFGSLYGAQPNEREAANGVKSLFKLRGRSAMQCDAHLSSQGTLFVL